MEKYSRGLWKPAQMIGVTGGDAICRDSTQSVRLGDSVPRSNNELQSPCAASRWQSRAVCAAEHLPGVSHPQHPAARSPAAPSSRWRARVSAALVLSLWVARAGSSGRGRPARPCRLRTGSPADSRGWRGFSRPIVMPEPAGSAGRLLGCR